MLTLDTSAVVALLDATDEDHRAAVNGLQAHSPPHVIPVSILSEIAWMISARLDQRSLDGFLQDVEHGRFALDCGEDDIALIGYLANRYANLPLGFADSAVVACGERLGGNILTFDRRDFDIVARDRQIAVFP